MRNYFVSFLQWLLSLMQHEDPAFPRAKQLVTWADAQYTGIRGERKRNQVINKLATEFPDRRLRDLSYLIEKALQEN